MSWTKLKRRLMSWWRPNRPEMGPSWTHSLAVLEDEQTFAPEWTELLAFDDAMARALRAEPVPSHLREAILREGPRKARRSAPFRWINPARLAWVTSVVLLASLMFVRSRPSTFAQYREEVVAQAWLAEDHLDIVSTNLTKVKTWVHGQGAPWPAQFPKPLGEIPVAGCRVFEAQGKQVTLICFANGMHHTHLFVMEGLKAPDQPNDQFPQLETCQGWRTASWGRDNQTFILSGLKNLVFLKQFRKERHWSWNG